MAVRSTVVHGYDRLAPLYDRLAALYSGGRIGACHDTIAARLTPGDEVLFVGAGSGRDAAAAAQRGIRPTLVDLSPRMLSRAARRFEPTGFSPTLVSGDIRAFDPTHGAVPPRRFDAVVTCFFLNVFGSDELPALIEHLVSLVRPGGRLWIADFAPPRGTRLARITQRLYHDLPMHTFRALTGNAIHSIHEIAPALERAGIVVRERTALRIFRFGPRWLEVIEGAAP